MQFIFFLSSFISLVSIFFIIFGNNLLYSILFLIISFLSTSVIFFLLGSCLAGFFQVVIYSGAILLLFVFFIMTIDNKSNIFVTEICMKKILKIFFLFLISSIFFIEVIYIFNNCFDNTKLLSKLINVKNVGKTLFSDYFFLIELSSMLLLESLIVSFYINKDYKKF
ncbi:MAG: NADH-quinone oxidoreductase subunit J [Buchnera aphidicola (Ceratovacuna japonica)]